MTTLGDASPPAPCDATCTLRDAVAEANADAAADTIAFGPGLAGEIRLTAGHVPIRAALTVQGPGRDVISVSGDANGDDFHDAGDSRIFFITPDAVGADFDPVTISGLTLRDGSAVFAGAILSEYASLTIDDVRVSNNRGTNGGGGVFHSYGPLTVTGSTFSSNTAPAGGGEGGGITSAGRSDPAPATTTSASATPRSRATPRAPTAARSSSARGATRPGSSAPPSTATRPTPTAARSSSRAPTSGRAP